MVTCKYNALPEVSCKPFVGSTHSVISPLGQSLYFSLHFIIHIVIIVIRLYLYTWIDNFSMSISDFV